MNTWTMATLGAAAILSVAGAAAAGPPAELKPAHVGGPGLYVTDLEAQKTWYSDKLGLSVRDTIQRGGTAYEYVMGYNDGPAGAVLALAKSTTRPPGPNAFSRVILAVPNAKGLADWLKGQGVENREVIANVAYFIRDPEGNTVELYTAPLKP
ncbi:VOC family protein [Phenylobacterium sp.]|uniref:VOC family protein n=1 Tax=Phenylobacterium sp. TaxID=1871053 RepID=UPI00121F9C17|nr:VOC family protein [Phenylobacterium sp.]THD64529.1 MAG: VOC family protein [Phenylobacterium sp.]